MTASGALSSRPAEPGLAVAAAALAAAVFLLAWGVLHHGVYAREQIVDTPVYQKYGDWIAEGRVPYRDFRPEYPPLAVPTFAVPSLLAGAGAPHEEYARRFEWLMAVCGVAAIALVAATLVALGAPPARLGAALALVALAPLALGSVMLSRYDLWPAALTAAAVAALASGRPRVGAAALGLSVAAKLYAGVLAPLLLVWVWRTRGRRDALVCAAILAGVVLACSLPFLLLAPEGVAASLGRQLSRPLQLESLAAGALVVGHHALGYGLEMRASHGSQNVGGWPGVAGGLVHSAVQLAALGWLWVRFARGAMERERLVRYAAASVVAFVALGKVLSPQFLIWLVPLVPLVAGRRGLAASGLLAVALVLTQLWFPFRYWDYARELDLTVALLVVARDLVLLGVLAALVAPLRRGGARRA